MILQTELYKSLIGETCIERVLESAIDTINIISKETNIAVWLDSGFKIHVFDKQGFTHEHADLIESCFNVELAKKIYKSRRCIELDELFEIGLPESETMTKLTAAVFSLQDIDQQGFILIYREIAHPIEAQDVHAVAAIIPALSKAI
jgi:hypothetical protein